MRHPPIPSRERNPGTRSLDDIFPRIKWRVAVEPGTVLPDGYGVAYYLFEQDVAIAMPIPLNLIVGGRRAFVMWLRYPPWRRYTWRIETIEKNAYRKGFNEGHVRAVFEERGCL